jgi:Ca-activated chloride channel family protein
MHFGSLENIWGLILTFLASAGLVYAYWRNSRFIEKTVGRELIDEVCHEYDPRRERVKLVLLVCCLLFAAVSLMRPQFGYVLEDVKRRGLDIVVAVDVSKSMMASDIKPNRLERSKLAIKDLVKKLKGDRVALIAFAGQAYLQCPLTVDYGGFLMSVDDLSVNTIPRPGTSISSALKQAIKSFPASGKKHRALVVITDGDDLEGDAAAAAKEAANFGMKIFCVGIGSPEGELIQVIGENGEKSFVKDRTGNVVKSRLNEKLLENIAAIGEGAYVRSSGADFGLDFIYEKKLASMEKGDIQSKMQKRYFERFQIPLTLAFICLLVEAVLTNRRKP